MPQFGPIRPTRKENVKTTAFDPRSEGGESRNPARNGLPPLSGADFGRPKRLSFLGLVFLAFPFALAACLPPDSDAADAPFMETVEVAGGAFVFRRDVNEVVYSFYEETTETVAGFRMGKYPVTQGQWKAVIGDNWGRFDGKNARDMHSHYEEITATPRFDRENLPVETVSWYEVIVFANKLSMKEGLKPAYGIKGETDPAKWDDFNDDWIAVKVDKDANGWRMPTEIEWEFAAKGGTKSAGYKGDESDTYFGYSGSDDVNAVAWYYENSGGRTHEVGKLKANELGLYDMSGNVWEWCFDKWDDTEPDRVRRGGGWSSEAKYVRSAHRDSFHPNHSPDDTGFRLVRSAQ